MKLTMLTLFVLIVGCLAASLNKALRFPEKVSLNNYIKIHPDFSKAETSLSICSWVKISRVRRDTYWFSYAVPGRDNEILLAVFGDNWFNQKPYRNAKSFMLKNHWYHFCFTWSKSTQMEFYINGVVVKSNTGDIAGIFSRGTLILGQEQDTAGGRYDINQAFGGDLHNLNVFSRKLSQEQVAAMYFDGRCSRVPSLLVSTVVLSWEQILGARRFGAVQQVSAECVNIDDKTFFGKVTKLVFDEIQSCK